jgi:dipeptidyl aminopeptidase/acylaminoacyl peptidase
VFQAAIAESGHADWTHGRTKWYDYELGTLKESSQLRWELSPINHVENVTTPIFVIHGKNINPEDQDSMRFIERLRRHNKIFRYKTYPDEGFYVHGIENRRKMLFDKLDFLKKFLKENGGVL